jgi:hypothetical protein
MARHAVDRSNRFLVRNFFRAKTCMAGDAGKLLVWRRREHGIVNKQRNFLAVPFGGQTVVAMTRKTIVFRLCVNRHEYKESKKENTTQNEFHSWEDKNNWQKKALLTQRAGLR